MKINLIIFALFLGISGSLPASTSLAFISGNNLLVPNTGDEVSPYTGTITGDPNLNNGSASGIQLFCDDYNNGVVYTSGPDSGQNATWTVNINSVTSANLGGTDGGRFETVGNLPATTTLYEEAAWLAAQVQSFSLVTGTQTQVTAAQDNQTNAQEALWDLTGGSDPGDNAGTGVSGVTNIAGWLADASADYSNEVAGYYNNWFVITETGQAGQTSDAGYQEFLTYSTTSIATAPEPASFILIGSGLMAAGIIGRRRQNKKARHQAAR